MGTSSYIVIAIVGAPETGKTTLARRLIRAHGGRAKILDPRGQYDGGEWPKKSDVDGWLRERAKERDYDIMVWDDADNYAPPYHQPLPLDHPRAIWYDYYIGHRHHGGDIVVVARRVQNLSRVLLSAVHTFYVFQVAEPNSRRALREFTDSKYDMRSVPSQPFDYVCVPVLSQERVSYGRTEPEPRKKSLWRKIWEW